MISKLNEYATFLNQGITYAVYSDTSASTEKIFPLTYFQSDTSERVGQNRKGLIQRNTALNMFLKDIYSHQQILKDKIIPEFLVKSSPHYCDMMQGFAPGISSATFVALTSSGIMTATSTYWKITLDVPRRKLRPLK